MEYGKRIIYDKAIGKVLNGTFEEMAGNLQEGLRPTEIDFIDLPFGDKILQDVDQYHIDVATKTIVIDSRLPHIETEAERLQREKEELENQLLLMADGQAGGIL